MWNRRGMVCQSSRSDQNRGPSNAEYSYYVLTYLWANQTYQFLKPPAVVVVNVSEYMYRRTSSSPKTGARLAKTKTTAMKIYHGYHLYQGSCNRVSRPVTGNTAELLVQGSPVSGNDNHHVQDYVSEPPNDDAPTESVHATFEAANESEKSRVLETNDSEERRPQRLRRAPLRFTYVQKCTR